MRKTNGGRLAVLCLLFLTAPLAFSEGSAEQEVSALTDQMVQANLKDDTAFYEKYYADDATIVHGNGKLFSKVDELADLRSGALKYESIDVREKKIRVYGDTAVVSLLITFKGSLSGKAFPPTDLRRTVVWVKQNGNWKVIAWQVTRVT